MYISRKIYTELLHSIPIISFIYAIERKTIVHISYTSVTISWLIQILLLHNERKGFIMEKLS